MKRSGIGPVRRAAALAAIAAVTVVVALAIGACSPKKRFAPNVPPETVLFLPDSTTLDTVNHVVHFYWFGTDPDGEVAGFEWRIIAPGTPADPPWAFTTRTDSVFEFADPTGYTRATFQVRAIDNQGQRDPTPASNDSLQFRDRPPVATLIDPPRSAFNDVTFPSVTLSWNASDPDGDAMHFRVWLDHNESNAVATSATTITLPSDAFCLNGFFYSGLRTAYVQAIDNGGMPGPIDSTTWLVRAPSGTVWPCGQRAKLLIVDDVGAAVPGNAQVDALYRSAVEAHLPDSSFGIATLTSRGPFRSARDVEQTLKLFEAVIWYRDIQTSVAPVLRDNQDAVGAYLDSGGKLYLEGLYLVDGLNAPGALGADFQQNHLDTPFLYTHFVTSGSFRDTSAAWGNNNGGVLASSVLDDSLRFAIILPVAANGLPGLRALGVRDTSEVLVWATDGALVTGVHDRFPIGVSVPQPNGGRAVVLAFPLRPCNGFGNVPRFLDKILVQLLGVTTTASRYR